MAVAGSRPPDLTGGTAEDPGVAEVGNGSVGEEDPIPFPVGSPNRRGHRYALWTGRSVVGSITECVDVASLGHQPIAITACVGHDRNGGS